MNISTLNALIEALKEGQPINKVLIGRGKKDRKVEFIKKLCRESNIMFQLVPQEAIDRKAGAKNQGVFAELSPIRFYELHEIVESSKTGLLLVLDRINDTGNLGALIRTAVAAEVDGVLISRRDSAPINETVLKTSAGTLMKAKICQSKNLGQDLDKLKEAGFWVVGTEMSGSVPYYDYDFSYKTALVMGSENTGMSPLLKKKADQLVSIPHSKKVESLNVSVSAGVILFEAVRQKKGV
jgi:23S rRNA (guanosine2251-2'-O)-methyltransferase